MATLINLWALWLVVAALLLTAALALFSRFSVESRLKYAGIVLLVPLVLATVLTATVSLGKAVAWVLGGSDHCLSHGHHLHLCLVHLVGGLPSVWAIAVPVGFGALMVHRLTQLGRGWLRASRWLSTNDTGRRLSHSLCEIIVVRGACAGVIGLFRPRLFIGQAALASLTPDSIAQILQHESAHLTRRDNLKRFLLNLLRPLTIPRLFDRFLATWQLRAELACDEAATRHAPKTDLALTIVTMLKLQRRAAVGPSLACSQFTTKEMLEYRIDVLLGNADAITSNVRRPLLFLIVSVALLVVCHDPLHHAIETLINF